MKKKEKDILSRFGDKYEVSPNDGGYCLYDKTRECKRANMQFIGKFYISTNGDKFVFRDDRYDTVESLVEAMDKYNKTLPFSPEIYDPTSRKSYQIEIAVYDYLTSLGFKHKRSVKHDIYVIEDVFGVVVCKIELRVEFDKSVGVVRRWIYVGDDGERWYDAPFVNLDTAIGACNSIIAGYISILQAQMLNVFKAMTEARASIVLDNNFDMKTFSLQTEDARQQMTGFLEQELNKLKQ